MPVSRNMFFAILLSTFIALLLSFLPKVEWSPESIRDEPVFNRQTQIPLTNQNLVDFMSAYAVGGSIQRIKWENQNLFIDFSVSYHDSLRKTQIYKDLIYTINRTFEKTNNVKRLFARYLLVDSKEHLLAALSVKRSQWEKSPPTTASGGSYERLLEKYYDLQHTALWDKKFPD